uniref:ATP synthase subunit a n=1 Tax=Amynthas hupeiensis TaxID=408830 RepID=A0A142AFT9_9ANNE|nr:ATP synthase F0 subunit 6 [Amynthas hupeiensis]AMO26950.1 ATP synthase F0 subunit 6 [Amynthas hupeiensis]BDQ43726.1 ATP synthase F0 subunit 6 [Amynthas hupeiensis]BDQ43739.1 ATP synthase F0 subunit 6 [Amynthas hupeiensis]
MMPDIFSSFDPYMYNTLFPTNSLFIIMNMSMVLLIQAGYWMINTRQSTFLVPIKSTIFTQLSRTFSYQLKGTPSIISSTFIILIMINLMGMIPYTFSTSSHLIFTLALGFPMWLSFIISSTFFNTKKTVAHLLPDGAPDWLNPFLVIIETTSIIVRPLTLSFRLAANMSAGHIVLSLVGIYCASAWFTSMFGTTMLILTTLGYVLFEFAICLIQAYIFCLLLSLYSDDHAH